MYIRLFLPTRRKVELDFTTLAFFYVAIVGVQVIANE
jgi:hypothetical protein